MNGPCQLSERTRPDGTFSVLEVSYCALGESGLPGNLRQFPVNKLKIDRSFVKHLRVNPDDAAITAAIISLAKNLNLRVIAEGVESEEQMSFLRQHHCDEIQGYYFSGPLPADEAARRLGTGAGRTGAANTAQRGERQD